MVAPAVPANVVLVLDKSHSMVQSVFDHDGDESTEPVTRWAALHGVVSEMTMTYQSVSNLGVSLFPTNTVTSDPLQACDTADAVEVPVGMNNAASILASIPAADDLEIYGATPAAAAITNAVEHLTTLDDGNPAAIILVTDGAANCGEEGSLIERFENFDENLPVVVDDAYSNHGIPTYVVGIDIQELSTYPAAEPRARMNEIAILGGAPSDAGEDSFYDAKNGLDLSYALDQIAADVACTVHVDALEGYDGIDAIHVGGAAVNELQSCADGDGYTVSFDGAAYDIEFCGAACDAFVAQDGVADIGFACPPVE